MFQTKDALSGLLFQWRVTETTAANSTGAKH